MMPSIEQAARNNWQRLLERVRHLESLPRSRFSTAVRRSIVDTTLVHGEDGTLFADTSGGVITVTLPSGANQGGRIFIVKDFGNATANTVTIDTTGAETIDGAASVTIAEDYGVFRFQTDGDNWFTI